MSNRFPVEAMGGTTRGALVLMAALEGGVISASFGTSNHSHRLAGHCSRTIFSRTNGPAMDFGGGIDFRLTRLLSIRCEGRDYVTRSNAGGFSGAHHAALDVGVGFHF